MDIRTVYETPSHYVIRVHKGYEVYRNGGTSAVRCAQIGEGPGPNLGLVRAIAECDRRSAKA